ncbi:hypothetical protein MWU54_17655 [Marivita sp. S6314]|uniref:hypothetical protein n=1 Tax=Marivita sp. S6314 TaxID=2926406 RepID=UPI001FF4FCA8|nr:hypothetical protein [Marivita sp. S6314]MCK0151874.1 hypothetical protein [Marivita sp. S6314]
MIASEAEREVLEHLRPDLEKQGYSIVEQPGRGEVPFNLQGYRPDFLATKGDSYIAYEVKAKRNPSIHKKLEELKAKIEMNPNWKFEIIYADEIRKTNRPAVSSLSLIRSALEEVRSVSEKGNQKAAFLLAWGTLESTVRFIHPKIFERTQSPGRIVTVLAERGMIDYDTANQLRPLVSKRNGLIHGDLALPVSRSDVNTVVKTVDYLVAT